MPNLVQTYALHDSDKKTHGGAIRINRAEAQAWNERGYGIFHTVNYFFGPRRLENLKGINAWAVDLDGGSKEAMLKRIEMGLVPTMVIESKNGFHVYWKAKDATIANYRLLLELRLIPYYQGDEKAKDLARLLRVPGYLHLKDPAEPFLVKKLYEKQVEYSEAEMFAFYKDLVTPARQKRKHAAIKKLNPGEQGFWNRVWNLNCEEALERLSGTDHVSGEVYSFRQNSTGTKNIFVNGNSTSCWIDLDGRIGSLDEGGPTILAWLNWFHKDWKRSIEIAKAVFPELTESPVGEQLGLLL